MYNVILILSPELHTHRFNCLPWYLIWVLNSLHPNLSLDFCSKPALSTVFHTSIDVGSIFQLVKPKISELFLFPFLLLHPPSSQKSSQLYIQNLSRTHPLLLCSPSLPSPSLPFCLSLPFLINRALKPSGVARWSGVSKRVNGVSTRMSKKNVRTWARWEGICMCFYLGMTQQGNDRVLDGVV